MDGNYSNTLHLRLSHADTAIMLDYPRHLCLLGVMRRIAKNCRVREGDVGGCPNILTWSCLAIYGTSGIGSDRRSLPHSQPTDLMSVFIG